MKQTRTIKQKLTDSIEKARADGAEYVCYGGVLNAVRIDNAIEYIQELPDDPGIAANDIMGWYECDAAGNRIIRAKEIFNGITRFGSGVIIRDGSTDVFCGSWIGSKGIPNSGGATVGMGTAEKLIAVTLSWKDLDEDILELAFDAAHAKGDKSPSISEVFRVNDSVTLITFDGWD
ncbi:MAG TPA: hypothetical protein VN367_08845 [Chlorobaculum sp.]|nr:hypothetical protein [Chlorobaculum sp.]